MPATSDKRYTVRNGAGDVLLSTDSIARAHKLIERLRGPVYIQYEQRGIEHFINERRHNQ